MLAPLVASALMLFQPDPAGQGRPAAESPPVVQATQGTHAGPSLAGFGVFVWAQPATPREARPPSVWQPSVPRARQIQLFGTPDSAPPDGRKAVTIPLPFGGARPKVICGTTVIIVDSQIDPKFVIAPGPGAGEPTIRRVPKPLCGEGQK
jgi:hypothetical protein